MRVLKSCARDMITRSTKMATKCCEHQSSWFFVKDRCGVARHVWTIPVDLYPLALGQDPLTLSQHHLSTNCLSCLLCSAVLPEEGTFSSSSCPMKRYWEFCALDAVDTSIGVTFTRDTSTLRSFLPSSSSSCFHSKTGLVSTLLCFVLLSAVLYC